MMTVEELSIRDQDVQEFISNHSNCVFSSQDWFRVLDEGLESKVCVFGLKKANQLKILIPGVILDFKIIKMFYSNIPYGGFIGSEALIQDFLPLLENTLRKKGIGIFRVCKQYHNVYDGLPNYRIQGGVQHIKSIGDLNEETNWQSYKKRIRRDIRKAEKSGVLVKPISDRSQMKILFDLYLKMIQRNQTYPVWTQQSFYSIYDNLVTCGKAQAIIAELNGIPIAGIISIFSNSISYYFMSASDTNYLTYCPNDLLLHHLITDSIARKQKYVDLMTSRESDTPLINFKDKWGTQKHSFYIYEKDLLHIRATVWAVCWRIANSKTGASLIRLFRR